MRARRQYGTRRRAFGEKDCRDCDCGCDRKHMPGVARQAGLVLEKAARTGCGGGADAEKRTSRPSWRLLGRDRRTRRRRQVAAVDVTWLLILLLLTACTAGRQEGRKAGRQVLFCCSPEI